MHCTPIGWTGRALVLATALGGTLALSAASPTPAADDALRPDYQTAAYAVTHARLVTDGRATIDDGTIVIRKGVIEAVGPSNTVQPPADAEVIDGKGLVVYPGFIDLHTTLGLPRSVERSRTGPGRPVPYNEFAFPRTPIDGHNGLTPEFEVAEVLELPQATASERRKLGFTDLVAAPAGAIATGQSALVSLGGLPRREAIVRTPLALHLNVRPPFEPPPSSGDDDAVIVRRRTQGTMPQYPTSLMGAVAHLRQAMLDSAYDHEAWAFYQAHGGPKPAFDPALRVLHQARSKAIPSWWEANTRDEIHRALDLAGEFGTSAVIVGGREAGRLTERLQAERVPVVLRLDFPDEPKLPEEGSAASKKPEERLIPTRVREERRTKWRERVGTAAALAKAGVRFGFSSEGLEKADKFHNQVRKAIEQGLPAEDAVVALTRSAAEIAGVADRLGTLSPGKLGHVTVLTGPYGESSSKVRFLFTDGQKFDLEKDAAREAARKSDDEPRNRRDAAKGKPDDESKPKTDAAPAKTDDPANEKDKKDESPAADKPAAAKDEPKLDRETKEPAELLPEPASELDEDRRPSIETHGNVLIKDARILTAGPLGTIAKGSILVRDGKIAAVGADLKAPDGTPVIDATGLVVTPGIIDTHSHIAISGGVNEMSLSIVPEVRVRDVIDGEDVALYRSLAGGTTTARLLHGSANTIGGQDAIIKLRAGAAGRDLLLDDPKRPQGVKFALGENVTRRRERFPNTRMGVEATIERAFLEGRAYAAARKSHDEARAKGGPVPPFRRDLRLEALAQIVEGSIKIHSHCYRSDEILMLLRVAERFGVRVRSLQHVLEGYKIAAEIAAHGASASTFSDWWAYKVEAFDAVPQNAGLLTEAGVSVCIKSDSDELIRHLYHEAAKMVKYGGVSEDQALAMITLNPARELGLEHRLGSIEVGKDADLALFNAHPFDVFARCELTLVDGEVRFERKHPEAGRDSRPGADTMPQAVAEARSRALDLTPSTDGRYALVGGTIHPVSGPAIQDGTVVVSGGKIEAVGGPETPIPAGVKTIDCRGLDLWPGMVDAGSLVGLFEIGSLPETQDFADSAPFQPELRTSVALHPESTIIPVTRANGILSAYVQPTGGTIAGQGALVDFAGWIPTEMVRRDQLALNVNIPAYSPPDPDARRTGDDPNTRRAERLEQIRTQFQRAIEYARVVEAARDGKAAEPTPDPRMAALVPYARGEKPVVFRADQAVEILDALKIAEELKLRAIITGGAEAWKVAPALKKAGVPVLVAGTMRLPLVATDPYDAAYTNPLRLHEAGVPFAIRSIGQGPDQATSARNLPYEAGMAAAHGLPDDQALEAVTLAPARILGCDDLVGSIEPGKRANLVITAGHLLQATTVVKGLLIGGKPLTPTSKQTELADLYQTRLQEVRSGQAPLGLDRPAPAGVGGGGAPAAPAPADSSR